MKAPPVAVPLATTTAVNYLPDLWGGHRRPLPPAMIGPIHPDDGDGEQ